MKKESGGIHFLYKTMAGRGCLKVLTRSWVSRWIGKFLDSRLSLFYISYFIKKHQIDMSAFEDKKYCSFNDFFKRSLCSDSRVIDFAAESLISPCDGLLTIYKIDEQNRIPAKYSYYRIEDLLDDRELAKTYDGGWCLVFRLRPSDYHHYCYIDNGEVMAQRSIPGILHCVRPLALEEYPVYIRNTREYAVIDTENFGTIVQLEMGALLVGKIQNHQNDRYVKRGTEKGYFEFGGSTIMILLRRRIAHPDFALWMCSKQGIEMEVKQGERIGSKGI